MRPYIFRFVVKLLSVTLLTVCAFLGFIRMSQKTDEIKFTHFSHRFCYEQDLLSLKDFLLDIETFHVNCIVEYISVFCCISCML